MQIAGMDIKGVVAEIQKDKSTPLVQKVSLILWNLFCYVGDQHVQFIINDVFYLLFPVVM